MPISVLAKRFSEGSAAPVVEVFCPGYEQGVWREEALVQDVFDRHLPSFALSYSELNGVTAEVAASALRKAASAVYDTDKYGKRGEFGELLLHAVLRDFYGADIVVSKIYYKSAANDTVKGFDGVHFVPNGSDIELWLGEAKFYSNLSAAVRDAVASLREHVQADFLRSEFFVITNYLDKDWPYVTPIRDKLAPSHSLDDIVSSLVIPVCLTYDSTAIGAHTQLTDGYISALADEAISAREKFAKEINFALDIRITLILLPLKSKESLVKRMHEKLRIWQGI